MRLWGGGKKYYETCVFGRIRRKGGNKRITKMPSIRMGATCDRLAAHSDCMPGLPSRFRFTWPLPTRHATCPSGGGEILVETLAATAQRILKALPISAQFPHHSYAHTQKDHLLPLPQVWRHMRVCFNGHGKDRMKRGHNYNI